MFASFCSFCVFVAYLSNVVVKGQQCSPGQYPTGLALQRSGILTLNCSISPCYLDKKLPSLSQTCHTGQASCNENSEIVSGVPDGSTVSMPLSLTCCSTQRTIGSKKLGKAVISPGTFFVGGPATDSSGRLSGLDILKNVRRDIDQNGDLAIVAQVQRLQCMNDLPETQYQIRNFEINNELIQAPPGPPSIPPPGPPSIPPPGPLLGPPPGLPELPALIALTGAACFSQNVMVVLSSGQKKMTELKVGDSVLSVVKNQPVFVKLTSFVHRVPDRLTTFQNIVTEKGNLEITPYHFLYVTKCASAALTKEIKYAKDVGPGQDCLLHVTADSEIKKFHVLENNIIQERGIYAPMTENGVIVTNGFVASCHSVLRINDIMRSLVSLQKLDMQFRSLIGYSNEGEEEEDVDLPWPIKFALSAAKNLIQVSTALPAEAYSCFEK